MREALKEFRDAVHRDAERRVPPRLSQLLQPQSALQFRWAAAAMVVIGLSAIPVYRERQREAEQQRADAVLMQQVNSAISRSAPRAFAALMGN